MTGTSNTRPEPLFYERVMSEKVSYHGPPSISDKIMRQNANMEAEVFSRPQHVINGRFKESVPYLPRNGGTRIWDST